MMWYAETGYWATIDYITTSVVVVSTGEGYLIVVEPQAAYAMHPKHGLYNYQSFYQPRNQQIAGAKIRSKAGRISRQYQRTAL